MEIELNFRLDECGRTSKQLDGDGATCGVPSASSSEELSLDYSSKTVQTNLTPDASSEDQKWIDDLLFDCQISDSGLMPRTFWVPAKGMNPRCHLEQMALDIFHHHVPKDLEYDAETSGAEWWAQIRPSPEKTGRYSMHDDQPDEISSNGISFHWDKDEDLRLLTGGTTFIHPHLSSVTYLTSLGAPTLAINYRVNNLTGEWIAPSDVEGFVSWPHAGKHLSFDGRYLHAAPPDLMAPGYWEKQLHIPEFDLAKEDARADEQKERVLKRRHRRVTFLVNIWLNFKPFDTKPFPESMIDKMSGTEASTRRKITFSSEEKTVATIETKSSDAQTQLATFKWPMGDCDSGEFIEASMPLQIIQEAATKGENIRIRWTNDTPTVDTAEPGIRLFKEKAKMSTDDEVNAASKELRKQKEVETNEAEEDTKRLKWTIE